MNAETKFLSVIFDAYPTFNIVIKKWACHLKYSCHYMCHEKN